MSIPGVDLFHFLRGTSDPERDLAANVILLALIDYCKLRRGKSMRIDGEIMTVGHVQSFLQCKDKDCDEWHRIANIPPLSEKALESAFAIYTTTGTLSYEGFERVILKTKQYDRRKKMPASKEGNDAG